MTPAEEQRFKTDVYDATLEIGGLVNARLRAVGASPEIALQASNHLRDFITAHAAFVVSLGKKNARPTTHP